MFRTPFLVVKMVVRTLRGGHFSENRVPGTLGRRDKRSNSNSLQEIEGQKPQNSDLRFTNYALAEGLTRVPEFGRLPGRKTAEGLTTEYTEYAERESGLCSPFCVFRVFRG